MSTNNIYVPDKPSELSGYELTSLIRQYEEMLAVIRGKDHEVANRVRSQIKEGLQVAIDEVKKRGYG